jgi:hypothetical protein
LHESGVGDRHEDGAPGARQRRRRRRGRARTSTERRGSAWRALSRSGGRTRRRASLRTHRKPHPPVTRLARRAARRVHARSRAPGCDITHASGVSSVHRRNPSDRPVTARARAPVPFAHAPRPGCASSPRWRSRVLRAWLAGRRRHRAARGLAVGRGKCGQGRIQHNAGLCKVRAVANGVCLVRAPLRLRLRALAGSHNPRYVWRPGRLHARSVLAHPVHAQSQSARSWLCHQRVALVRLRARDETATAPPAPRAAAARP